MKTLSLISLNPYLPEIFKFIKTITIRKNSIQSMKLTREEQPELKTSRNESRVFKGSHGKELMMNKIEIQIKDYSKSLKFPNINNYESIILKNDKNKVKQNLIN